MLSITQFEVYVLQNGRWTLHARYPGEDRQEAVRDAHTTEATTGFPAKVVRETYFPDVNDSERITVYASPKAKAQTKPLSANQRRRPPLTAAARAAAGTLARRDRPAGTVRPLTPAQIFFRVIIAGGMSLVAATLMTGIVAWSLHRLVDAGMNIASDPITLLLTYAYVLTFLFFFWTLFRSRLPLHRILADLWQKASAPTAAGTSDTKLPHVKPKHNRPPSPETLREWEDLKVKRGDLDPLKLETDAKAASETVPSPEQPKVSPSDVPPIPAPVAPLESAKADTSQIETKQSETKKGEAAKLDESAVAPVPVQAPDPRANILNLERMVLRRFAVDVVMPAIRSAMPDDPVARRGAALLLAGGAAGVATTAQLDKTVELELLSDALHHVGMNQPAIDSFMAQHIQQINGPANIGLLAAGQSALAAHLQGATDITRTLTSILAGWRTPLGQNAVPDQGNTGADVYAAPPLLDVYMLTELREDQHLSDSEAAIDAFHDRDMGTHNGLVRAVIAVHGGHEVKHTGKGIFSRFAEASPAIDAARDIQRAFSGSGSKLAIGLVGNTTAGEHPILSASLIRQAQAMVARTGAGEILCEAKVQAAASRQRRDSGRDAADPGTENLDLVRLAPSEPEFEAPTGRSDPAAPHP